MTTHTPARAGSDQSAPKPPVLPPPKGPSIADWVAKLPRAKRKKKVNRRYLKPNANLGWGQRPSTDMLQLQAPTGPAPIAPRRRMDIGPAGHMKRPTAADIRYAEEFVAWLAPQYYCEPGELRFSASFVANIGRRRAMLHLYNTVPTFSLSAVAEFFELHHTTVLYALRVQAREETGRRPMSARERRIYFRELPHPQVLMATE
jgi:hypothetical protein